MNPNVLRLLDANANRAREGLRVIEDYARFVLNDDPLCFDLKQLRHDLSTATARFAARSILYRDTPGDVGTTRSTPDENRRDSLDQVIVAAGKRLGEALRTLEEYAKTDDPRSASLLELIRYRFYDLERRVALTLRSANRFAQVRLYVLITERLCARPWLDTAKLALQGGADALQLREKELPAGELLRRARQLTQLCREHHALCIINDRPDIALLAGADGVHVGQDDLPADQARRLIGPDFLLGVSTHHLDQARAAQLSGADYLGVGPVFPSQTKPRDILPGLEYARQVARQIPLPAVAIAGITPDNAPQVMQTGVSGIAASSLRSSLHR